MTEKNDTSRLTEKYIFRNIRQEEIAQTAEIEKICFPPNEACSYAAHGKTCGKSTGAFSCSRRSRYRTRLQDFSTGLLRTENI